MTNQKKISVNAVNLKQRTDRRDHILKQFSDKPEFLFNIVPAIIHEKGAYGLWQTIRQIVNKENEKNSDFFILCEDDHMFTEDYSFDLLQNCIEQATSLNADMRFQEGIVGLITPYTFLKTFSGQIYLTECSLPLFLINFITLF